ncbi:MAG: acyl-CoA dehydrogenase family protein, partial [Solirubrobacterales bacterium]
FGKPIAEHQAIQFKLADMATKVEAAQENALDAMRIHGGYGYSPEFRPERYYRDAPLLLIGEGTSEIQRMVIGKKLLQRHKI